MISPDTVNRIRTHAATLALIAPQFCRANASRCEFYRNNSDVLYAKVYFGEMLVDEFPAEVEV